jgi:hypothetical protein
MQRKLKLMQTKFDELHIEHSDLKIEGKTLST